MSPDLRQYACAILLVSAAPGLLAQQVKPEPATQPAATQPADGSRLPTTRPSSWVPRAPGPWDASLHAARSTDGLEFKAEAEPILRDAAGPTIARLPDRGLLLVFEFYSHTDRRLFDTLGFLWSTDEGKTWSKPQALEISGLNRDAGPPRSPALAVTPDGEVRLYFICKDRTQRTTLRCAVWKPGAIEAGRVPEATTRPADAGEKTSALPKPPAFESAGRVTLASKPVLLSDVAAAYFEREWHLFGTFADVAGRRYHGTSKDGRHFQQLDHLRVDDVGTAGSIVGVLNGLRFYGASRSGVVSATSADAKTWSHEPGVRLSGGEAPAALRLKDESWLMIYAKSPPIARSKRKTTPEANPTTTETVADQPADTVLPGEEDAAAQAAEGRADGELEQSPGVSGQPGEMQPQGQSGGGTDGDQVRMPGEQPGQENELAVEPTAGAATETDFQGFQYTESGVPIPDFIHRIDYWSRYAQQHDVDSAPDNAWHAYEALLFDPERGPTGGTALPPFVGMFRDTGYLGPPMPWNPAEHPDWDQWSIAAAPYLTRFAEAAGHANYVRPMLASHEGPIDGPPRSADDEADKLLLNMILPDLSGHRELVKQAMSDAWRAPNGKPDPQVMINTFDTCLRDAEHVGNGDTLIEKLVGIAEKSLVEKNARYALQHEVFSADQLESALEVLVTRDRPLPNAGRCAAGEMVFSLDVTQYVFGVGEGGAGRTLNPERLDRIQDMFGGTEIPKPTPEELASTTADQVTRNFVDFYRTFDEMSRRGYPEVKGADLDEMTKKYAQDNYVSKAMLPSLSRAYQLMNRAEASRRATQLSYAVHLYKARTGQWPQSLNDLPARYTAGARTDPFSGQDFVYRPTESGFTIYSTSENGRDDGGAHHPRWNDETGQDPTDDYVFWPPQ